MSEYKNEAYLRTEYCEKEKTLREIASDCGVSIDTIWRWMENHGIDRRRRGSYQVKPYAKFQTLQNGYEYWHDGEAGGTTKDWVLVHRLLAVAEFGFDSVQSDIDVHHKNGVRWDNRPENIGLMTHSNHASYHHNEGSNQGGNHA